MADRKVRASTLVGVDRRGIYEIFAEKGFTKGCEVGVRQGVNAKLILSIVPGLRLYLVDPYMVYEYRNFRKRNKWKWDLDTMDRIRFSAIKRLAKANVIWLMTTSAKAAQCIEDASLDFVYIDANHSFSFVMEDIIIWGRKVKKGGIISGHDWGIRSVRRAVTEYAKYNRLPIKVTDREMERGKSGIVTSWMLEK